MNKPIHTILDKTSLLLGIRPNVSKEGVNIKFPSGESGGVVISADFELAWAFRYSKSGVSPVDMAMQARSNFPKYLSLFEQYNIPITWATVGHLMLDSCRQGDHDWMARLPYFSNSHKWNFQSGDWFDCDPYSTFVKENAWYAPDLIDNILNSKVCHEIGCHTFSHVDFSDSNCPRQVAYDEIKACVDLAKKWDIKLKSIVFPGGTYGNVDVLKDFGITNYRRNMRDFKLATLFNDDSGLYMTPTSLGLGGVALDAKSIGYHKFRIEKHIDMAIKTNTICHLWFHPSVSPKYVDLIFPWLCDVLSKKREKGELWIGTMDSLTQLKDD